MRRPNELARTGDMSGHRMTIRSTGTATNADDAGQTLHQLINGYRISQAIHVAASLHIADHLVAGPRTSHDLATTAGTHPESLYRLLRALAAAGVLHEGEDRTFSLTSIGQYLRCDIAGSRHAWATFSGRPSYWGAWGELLHSVRTGGNAFKHMHGVDVWAYRAQNPSESEIFDAAMREGSLRAVDDVAESFDFGRFQRIADIGGGDGSFIASILKAYDNCHGILFDQPHVVAAASNVLHEADVANRCKVVGGNFFEAVPLGYDAYVLKFIIHDWQDEQAIALLRMCRRACKASSRLVLVERVLASANEGLEGKFSDLNMLVSAGGRERTLEEFEVLFEAAQFAPVSVARGRGWLTVIEAAPI
jgi:hypothetical protein